MPLSFPRVDNSEREKILSGDLKSFPPESSGEFQANLGTKPPRMKRMYVRSNEIKATIFFKGRCRRKIKSENKRKKDRRHGIEPPPTILSTKHP